MTLPPLRRRAGAEIMDSYFVHKPAVAWVIALFIALFGTMALINLPIEQYPAVAPPSLTLSYTYNPTFPK